jgi:hypothetical protein
MWRLRGRMIGLDVWVGDGRLAVGGGFAGC